MIHDGRGKVQVVDVIIKAVFGAGHEAWQGAGRCLVREGIPRGQRHLGEASHDGRRGREGRDPGTVAVLWLGKLRAARCM